MTLLQQQAEEVWTIVQQVRDAQSRICVDFLEIGRLLKRVKDERLHSAWASHINTFDDFLVDVGLRRTSAYNAIRVFEQYGHHQVEGIPMDRLVALSEMKLPEDEKPEWLEKAREMPARGLRDEARERRGLQPLDLCEHDQQIVLHKCLECGRMSDKPLS